MNQPVPEPSDRPERHTLFMMDHTREGTWEVPPRLELRGTRTVLHLDLTEATFAAPEVVIDLALYNGRATFVVGSEVEVVVAAKAFAGPDTPHVPRSDGSQHQVVVLTGYARLMSSVVVTRA